jgi:predicted SAM-dependent methyltransferase
MDLSRRAAAALSLLNRPQGRRRLRSALAAPSPVKVNIGAGATRLDGWVNTDIMWRAEAYLDLLRPWPTSGGVDYVYGDNVIEHFTLRQGRVVLAHARRAMADGATIRLATPDVERTARAYLDDPDLAAEHLERHRRVGYTADYPVDLLRLMFTACGHAAGFLYDEQVLTAELVAAGFGEVRRCDPGQSDDPNLKGLEGRLTASESATALIVEATVSAGPTGPRSSGR